MEQWSGVHDYSCGRASPRPAPGRELWRRIRYGSVTAVRAVVASLLATIGLVVVVAGPASAHANVVNGDIVCGTGQQAGQYVITWTIANDYNLTETATLVSATGGTGTVSGSPVGIAASPGTPYKTGTMTQLLPLSTSGTISLTVSGLWSDKYTQDDSGTATLDAHPGCTSTTTTHSSLTGSATLGSTGSVTDTATVTGNPEAGAPTGKVNFYWCYNASSSPTNCTDTTGSPTAAGTPSLTTGTPSADQSQATSTGFTPSKAGYYCFFAKYVGDSKYNSSSENLGNTDQASVECFRVTAVPSTTTTHSSTTGSVALGSSGAVTDTVTVTGNSTGGAPTGTVNFYWCYDPSTSPTGCNSSGTAAGSPGLTTGTPTANQSQAGSTPFTPGKVGFYCFFASYGGDNNYAPSSENLGNPDQASVECFHITQASSATTTHSSTTGSVTLGASGSVTDTVTVTGNSAGGAPTGNVSFYWCYSASSAPDGLQRVGHRCGTPGLTTGTPTANQSQATSTGVHPVEGRLLLLLRHLRRGQQLHRVVGGPLQHRTRPPSSASTSPRPRPPPPRRAPPPGR